MSSERRLRVAAVGYTNAWPLTRFLDRRHFEVLEGVPSEAARKLRAQEADLGLVPVAALLNDGDWKVVPGHAIGCDGAVASVLLVGETPLEEWEAVALDGESRTSVILAQILLKGPLKRPDLRVMDVDAGSGAFHAQGKVGAVVIGDAALNLPARLTHRIDLGKVWKDWTGLPFVFAVWASRVDLRPEELAGLRAAAARGLAERVFAPAGERAYLTQNVRYDFDDRAMMGLRRFAALGHAAGLFRREDFSLIRPQAVNVRVDVESLLAKGAAGERLSNEEGLKLLEEAPLDLLGAAAQQRRAMIHPGRDVMYRMMGNLDYSQVCNMGCSFCNFHSNNGANETVINARLDVLGKAGATEIWLQGGMDPELSLSWHEALIGRIKQLGFQVSGYGPDEVIHLARRETLSPEAVLDRLCAAGLTGMPGLGAEVLSDRVRRDIAPRKANVTTWFSVMRAAQQRGLGGPATLVLGLGESPEERIQHLSRIRALQDETGGFTGFLPWTYLPARELPTHENTATALLRMVALSRLFLDNVVHIQASWHTLGLSVAQALLWAGANALGPVLWDGSALVQGATEHAPLPEVLRHVRAAGLNPVCPSHA